MTRLDDATIREAPPRGPIDILERWARALFLRRRHLLLQSEVFNHEAGSAPTHRA